MTGLKFCGDCGVAPGSMHLPGCDVERCARCGLQAISCVCIYVVNGINPDTLELDHPAIWKGGPTEAMYAVWERDWGRRRMPWTGEWPGLAECIEFGWHAKLTRDKGWIPCSKDDPEAHPDLNRLLTKCRWDADAQKWVQRGRQVRLS